MALINFVIFVVRNESMKVKTMKNEIFLCTYLCTDSCTKLKIKNNKINKRKILNHKILTRQKIPTIANNSNETYSKYSVAHVYNVYMYIFLCMFIYIYCIHSEKMILTRVLSKSKLLASSWTSYIVVGSYSYVLTNQFCMMHNTIYCTLTHASS